MRTGISKAPGFYDDLEKRGLLTDINNVVAGFEVYLGKTTRSGECQECGPEGSRVVQFMDFMDAKTEAGVEAVQERSGGLWVEKK